MGSKRKDYISWDEYFMGVASLEGAKLYVSLFPCNECAKAIIQSGIKEVIYDCNKYEDTPAVQASMRMFDSAGVRYHQYHRTDREITIQLENALKQERRFLKPALF